MKYDLIVVGGGFSGVASAVAAAREGIKVLLIEKTFQLGGAATNSLVNPFMPWNVSKRTGPGPYDYWTEDVNCGLFAEIVERLEGMDGYRYSNIGNDRLFNTEILKLLMERMCIESGVELLYDTRLVGAKVEDGKIQSVQIVNREGFSTIEADYFIDCSGDANLAALAGVPYCLGSEEDSVCQSMTMMFWIGNVDAKDDEELCALRPTIRQVYLKAKEEGKIKIPRDGILPFLHIANGIVNFNVTRVVGKDPTKAVDMTMAQIEAREQAYQVYLVLKENIEAFKNSVFLATAPEIGVRESRKIEGDYCYTEEDIVNYAQFDDSIARGCYPVDIHTSTAKTDVRELDSSKYYTIPYRTLIPKTIENMLVAGRCFSATHVAQSACRIMPIVCCMGEAAGYAISVAAKENLTTREIDVRKVQELIKKNGGKY